MSASMIGSTRLATTTTLGLLLLALASCGYGSAVVGALLSDKKKNTERVPTDLTLITPTNGQAGRVALRVDLDVDVKEAVQIVSVEYALRGNIDTEFRRATPALGFPADIIENTMISGTDLAAAASEFRIFVWNSHFDLDQRLQAMDVSRPVTARAVLRIKVRNTVTEEELTKVTDEFFLDESLVETVAGGGVGDGVVPTVASMLDPVGIATDAQGNAYVADSGNHRIRRIVIAQTVATLMETVIGNGFEGTLPGTQAATLTSMNAPVAVAVDTVRNLFVAEKDTLGKSHIRYFEQDTALISDFMAGFESISSLFLSADQRLYIADEGASTVWFVSLAGIDPSLDPPRFADLQPVVNGNPMAFVAPAAVAAVADTVYVAERTSARVLRTLAGAAPIVVAGGGGMPPAIGLDATAVQLVEPSALAATATHYFVADLGADLVVVVDVGTNTITNVLTDVDPSSRPMQRPAGLACDGAGNLLIVETGQASLLAGAKGHQVLMAMLPENPNLAQVNELAAGSAGKGVTQSVGSVTTVINGVTVIQDTVLTG